MQTDSTCTLIWLALLGCAVVICLCTVTPLDLRLSACFYDATRPSGWFLGDVTPWKWLYRYGEYPAIGLAVAALGVFLGSYCRRAWVAYRRLCLVVILALALGPGVLVNGVLKPFWGRPRPRHIMQFGGSKAYLPWWRPGAPGTGKSFPSGHAAMGYSLIVGVLFLPRQRWRLWGFAAGLTYGTLLGLTRIVQGGHFVSDAAWSGALMCGLVLGLHTTLQKRLEEPCGPS